ncbi:MBL fold metallo-hydrolase [bacterium]|nr:MBL fold metallo-hydrolase [candidate division CSSED10-310 bacterium]
MNIALLGSGSEGNAVLIADGSSAILVDAGFSGSRLQERLNVTGYSFSDIRALVITHEHSDHVRGAGVLARRLRIPVFATEGTLRGGRSKFGHLPHTHCLEGGRPIEIAGFQVHPFDISHDAEQPVGFVVEHGSARLGVCTDSGCVTHLMRQRLRLCDALILETNHDSTMLLAGPYPWELKQRIRSRVGHLSNDDAGGLLEELWHPGLSHIFLAHLSRENNLPDLARLAAEDALRRAGCFNGDTRIHVALQDEVTEMISI